VFKGLNHHKEMHTSTGHQCCISRRIFILICTGYVNYT